jgi:hypothetical protein
LAAVLAVAFIACGDDESTEDATLQLCTELAELGTAARTLSEINETNTFDELEAAQDDVDQAVEDVKSSAENVAEARVDEGETAREARNGDKRAARRSRRSDGGVGGGVRHLAALDQSTILAVRRRPQQAAIGWSPGLAPQTGEPDASLDHDFVPRPRAGIVLW